MKPLRSELVRYEDCDVELVVVDIANDLMSEFYNNMTFEDFQFTFSPVTLDEKTGKLVLGEEHDTMFVLVEAFDVRENKVTQLKSL